MTQWVCAVFALTQTGIIIPAMHSQKKVALTMKPNFNTARKHTGEDYEMVAPLGRIFFPWCFDCSTDINKDACIGCKKCMETFWVAHERRKKAFFSFCYIKRDRACFEIHSMIISNINRN